MAMYGVEPLKSENANIVYRSIVVSIVRGINRILGEPDDREVIENGALGAAYALLALCRQDKTARDTIAKGQVAEWREKFVEWVDAPERKIPKKFFKEYRENACRLFDELEELAGTYSRALWVTDGGEEE